MRLSRIPADRWAEEAHKYHLRHVSQNRSHFCHQIRGLFPCSLGCFGLIAELVQAMVQLKHGVEAFLDAISDRYGQLLGHAVEPSQIEAQLTE